MTTVRILRNYILRNGGKTRTRRFAPQNVELCRRLDESMLAFRAARKMVADEDKTSWLRAVRQATGIPVYVLAKRLGVTKYEVFRLEKTERESRIMLANLKRAAEALGCELVYALTPREGSLEDLAAAERTTRAAAQAMVLEKKQERIEQVDEWADAVGTLRRLARREFRKMGLRVQ